jgi:glycosyltransferase involved in cell wall biosynthesis
MKNLVIEDYREYRDKYFLRKNNILNTDDQNSITIFTIVRNAEETIEKTIRSVLSQNYKNFEYIIVDGCSTDRTLEIIKKYEEKINLWTSEKDLSPVDAANKAISVASGEIIFGLSADDWIEPGLLSSIAEIFSQNPSFDFLYGDMHMIYSHEKKLIKGIINYKNDLMRGDPSFNYPCMAYKKSCFNDIGVYDLKYKFNNDYEYLLRLTFSGYKGYYTPRIRVNRLPGGIGENNHIRSAVDRISIMRKYKIPFLLPTLSIFLNLLRLYLFKIMKNIKNRFFKF